MHWRNIGGNVNIEHTKIPKIQICQKGEKTYRFFRIEGLDFCAEEMGDKSEIAGLLVEDGD